MASFFLPVSSCQHRPSTPGFCSKSVGRFFGSLGHPTLLSVAHSPPALAIPAILHICLFLGCSLRTRERREMFQTVSGQGCLGLVEKAFALSLPESSLTLPQAHFTDGARSSGQDHNLLWVSAMGSGPTLPHRLIKDWESMGSCCSPPKPPLTSHRIPNHDRNNMEEGDVTVSICCMLSTVPICFYVLNLRNSPGKCILFHSVGETEAWRGSVTLCGEILHVISLTCFQ